ncbi:MAG TPA: hypothetical protein VFI45_10800 [Candidatus Acidoferrum sp.]|nr:hypothetical protein [Candidatus Acidoferrum sp.]
MKGTLAIAVLVALLSIATMQTAAPGTDVEQSYFDTVKAWESSEKRTVSPKVEKAIASAFAQYDPEFLDGDIAWKDSRRTLKQTLLICYLDRLRDRFPSFEEVGPVGKRPPPEDREMELEDGATYDIERYDVARYTVDNFMRDVRPVLTGHKGELVVVPGELPSSVTVDGHEIGRAGTISVESAGEHRILVRNKVRHCGGKIVVVDGASSVFPCP